MLKEPSPSLPRGDYSAELINLVEACLRKDPSERPSARQLLSHPFIQRHGSASAFSLKRFLCETFSVTPEPSPVPRSPSAAATAAPAAPDGSVTLSVTCPAGSAAGDTIEITHEGAAFELAVPEGVVEGESFDVVLDVSAAAAPPSKWPQTAEETAAAMGGATAVMPLPIAAGSGDEDEVHRLRQELQAAQYANRQLRVELPALLQ